MMVALILANGKANQPQAATKNKGNNSNSWHQKYKEKVNIDAGFWYQENLLLVFLCVYFYQILEDEHKKKLKLQKMNIRKQKRI